MLFYCRSLNSNHNHKLQIKKKFNFKNSESNFIYFFNIITITLKPNFNQIGIYISNYAMINLFYDIQYIN